MKDKLTVHQRRSWQARMRVIGAISLALIAVAGLFVALRPQPATAQSTDGQSAEQTPALQAQTAIQTPQAPTTIPDRSVGRSIQNHRLERPGHALHERKLCQPRGVAAVQHPVGTGDSPGPEPGDRDLRRHGRVQHHRQHLLGRQDRFLAIREAALRHRPGAQRRPDRRHAGRPDAQRGRSLRHRGCSADTVPRQRAATWPAELVSLSAGETGRPGQRHRRRCWPKPPPSRRFPPRCAATRATPTACRKGSAPATSRPTF